jgi:hypothetical protein
MRIIKGFPTLSKAAEVIAGEMYNIEAGRLIFIDGKALDEPHAHYPVIADGAIVNRLKSPLGYIYVGSNVKLDEFEELLISAILMLGQVHGSSLAAPHTVTAGLITNIRVVSQQQITRRSNNLNTINVLRQFTRTAPSGNITHPARFTWVLRNISTFDYTITSTSLRDDIARFSASIFYDTDDICTLDHNAITHAFSRELLRGYSNIIHDVDTIIISAVGHPLAFELSDYWRYNKISRRSLHDLPARKIFSVDRRALTVGAVDMLGETSDVVSEEICMICRSILWGDFYIFAGHIDDPTNPISGGVCALCAHEKRDAATYLENRYFRIFRVTSDITPADMISRAPVSKREILTDILNCVKRVCINTHLVTLLGDHYAAVDTDAYLYGGLWAAPELAGRRICAVEWAGL